MDSIAILSNTYWKLNTIRKELIEQDLNSPYARLWEEEIKPSDKLFGEDLLSIFKIWLKARK